MTIKDIIEQINTMELVNEIDPSLNIKDTGSAYTLICPKCKGGKTAERCGYIYKNNPSIINCHRQNDCGHKTSLFDLYRDTKSLNNRETVIALKRMAGIPVHENSHGDNFNYYYFFKKFLKTLFEPAGIKELNYLLNRGYTRDEIKKMEVGAFILETLSEEEKKSLFKLGLSLKGLGETNTLAIPFRGINGNIIGFAFRCILSSDEIKKLNINKYKYSYGLKTSEQFFNFNKRNKTDFLILVEGLLDARYFTVKGVKGVAAVAKAIPSDEQLSVAVENGVREFIFCLDVDRAGIKAVRSAVKRLDQMGIFTYVVDDFQGYKDPDELVRDNDIDSFYEVLSYKLPGYKWLAQDMHTNINSSYQFMKYAADEYLKIKSNFNREVFINEVANLTKMNYEEVYEDFTRNEIASTSNKVKTDILIDKEKVHKLKKIAYRNKMTVEEYINHLIDISL